LHLFLYTVLRTIPVLISKSIAQSVVAIGLLIAISVPVSFAQDDIDGEGLFKKLCTQCHTIGKGKLIGPDLLDAHKRVPSEEWMVPWIQNSQAVIKSGDEYGVKIFEEYNKTVMTANAVSDDEALAIIAYMKEEGAKSAEMVASSGPANNPYLPPVEEKADNTQLYILITFAAIFFVVIAVLRRVNRSLKQLIAEKNKLPAPASHGLIGGIMVWMGGNKRLVALGIIALLAYGAKASWDWMLFVDVEQGYEPEQPIWFSHQVHAGENGINCVYCHSSAEKGKTAGIPSANVCMNCHKAVKEGEYSGTQEIAKIYEALDYDPEKQTYGDNPKPIEWVRIHNLPDLSYFNHSQHVVVGDIECQTCHGPVEEMHVMRQESMLTMGWCVDCHRKTEVKMEGNPYYDDLHAKLMEKHPGEKITVDKMGGIDCARCHY
jgi:cytochrome c2